MSDLYFNEKKIYSEGNTVQPDQKKTGGNDSHKKGTKHIHASAANLLHIKIDLDWRKCRQC